MPFVNAGTLADGSAGVGSLSVAKPSGITTGDIAFVHFVQYGSYAIVGPPDSSWFMLPANTQQGTNDKPYSVIYWHVVTSSEPLAWLFNFSGSIKCAAISCAYRGIGSFVSMNVSFGSGTTATAPSVSGMTTGDLLLQFIFADGASPTITLDGALTSRYSVESADDKIALSLGEDSVVANPSTTYNNSISSSSTFGIPVIILSPTGSLPTIVSDYGVVAVTTGNAETTNGTETLDCVVPTPAGTRNGDIIVAFIQAVCNHTLSLNAMPSGFSLVRSDFQAGPGPNGGNITSAIATHAVTASAEPANYTFSIQTNGGFVASYLLSVALIVIRGCSGIDTTSLTQQTDKTKSTVSTTPYTPGYNNELILNLVAGSSNTAGATISCPNQQREYVKQSLGVFSSYGGLSGESSAVVVVNDSIPDIMNAYQVGFIPVNVNTTCNFLGFTSVNSFSGASQAIDVPSSPNALVADDVLVAHVIVGTAIGIIPPAGWTAIPNTLVDDGNRASQSFSHTVVNGDPTNITFTFESSTTGCLSISAFRNAIESFVASNSTTEGLAPGLANISSSTAILFYEMARSNGGAGTLGSEAVGLISAPNTIPTALAYNNLSLELGGKLTIFPSIGPANGMVGTLFRPAFAGLSGPQTTIAIARPNPTPPNPPPSPPSEALNNALLLYTMGQRPGWSKHVLPFNVLTVQECVLPGDVSVNVVALGDDKNVYLLFNNPQGAPLTSIAESQPLPTRKQVGVEIWDTNKDFLYFYVEGQDLANFQYQSATDTTNFNTFVPTVPLSVKAGRNILNVRGKQIVLRFIHSVAPAVGVTPLLSYIKIAYTLSGKRS